jgi:serine/threonine-protein kinase
MTGKTILNYRITRLIGEGGMAKVYEAEHINLGNKVAIKILDPLLASKSNIKERFRNEARIMASLMHENIVRVIDYYEDDDNNVFAIVMEYLDGENLSDFIKSNGALSKELAYDLMVKILKAFGYAHSKGLVHRDVKPGNIFITSDKNIKILDFGIAKLLHQNAELTGTGMQMGTPMYMSPEQVKDSKHIDKRSDIYSLGVMLYYMLSGNPPYDTTTYSNFDIFNKIVNEPLPELSVNAELNIIIEKATAKQPEERYQQ